MCERMYGTKTVKLVKTGDQGCDFCVAIVKHWKDVLTSNTTELEFKEVNIFYITLWVKIVLDLIKNVI